MICLATGLSCVHQSELHCTADSLQSTVWTPHPWTTSQGWIAKSTKNCSKCIIICRLIIPELWNIKDKNKIAIVSLFDSFEDIMKLEWARNYVHFVSHVHEYKLLTDKEVVLRENWPRSIMLRFGKSLKMCDLWDMTSLSHLSFTEVWLGLFLWEPL